MAFSRSWRSMAHASSSLAPAPGTQGVRGIRGFRAEKLGDETVYVEADGFVNEIGGSRQENVWTLREGDLHLAGSYFTLEERHPYGGDDVPDDAGFFTLERFTGIPRYVGGEVVLKGESTWQHATVLEGGISWTEGRRIPWTRRFQIRDGALVETGPESRWGHALEEKR